MTKYFVNVDVNYIGTHNKVTFADVDFEIFDEQMNRVYYVQKKAVAQRNYEDKQSELIGVKLALGRALEQLGKALQKGAWGEVTHHDNMKRVKQAKPERASVEAVPVNASRRDE